MAKISWTKSVKKLRNIT